MTVFEKRERGKERKRERERERERDCSCVCNVQNILYFIPQQATATKKEISCVESCTKIFFKDPVLGNCPTNNRKGKKKFPFPFLSPKFG